MYIGDDDIHRFWQRTFRRKFGYELDPVGESIRSSRFDDSGRLESIHVAVRRSGRQEAQTRIDELLPDRWQLAP